MAHWCDLSCSWDRGGGSALGLGRAVLRAAVTICGGGSGRALLSALDLSWSLSCLAQRAASVACLFRPRLQPIHPAQTHVSTVDSITPRLSGPFSKATCPSRDIPQLCKESSHLLPGSEAGKEPVEGSASEGSKAPSSCKADGVS